MNNFDERQVLIRGKIFMHMYIILVIFLFFNALLYSFDIIWINGFHSSILITMIATAIGSVEAIVRDVYFKNTRESFLALSLLVIGTSLFILSIMHIIDGASIISDGELTQEGFSFILSLTILSIGISGVLKFLINKKKEHREGKE